MENTNGYIQAKKRFEEPEVLTEKPVYVGKKNGAPPPPPF